MQPSFILYIENIIKNYTLISSSGTLNIGTNGSVTVSGSNYGALSCSSSSTTIATCSVSGTTVTMVPKAAGSATITVTGNGVVNSVANYNSISKTYVATVQLGITYTYWTAKNPSTSIGDYKRTNESLKNTVAFTSDSNSISGSTPSSICESSKVYCIMFRDIYESNTYKDRELCIYISIR